MVKIAVCHPLYSKVGVFKDSKKQFFNLSMGLYKKDLPYRPWESYYKDLMDYLEIIHSKCSTNFDYLIAILDEEFNNDFRQNFLFIGASFKFKNIRILDSFHLSLFSAVKEMKLEPIVQALLWDLTMFRDFIQVKVWYYFMGIGNFLEDGWTLSKVISHKFDGPSPTHDDFKNLYSKLEEIHQEGSPYIILRNFSTSQKKDFTKVCSSVVKIVASKSSYPPCKLAMKFGIALSDEDKYSNMYKPTYLQYRCRPVLNKSIEIKSNSITLLEMDKFKSLPTDKIVPFDSAEDKNEIEIFEAGKRIKLVKLELKGKFFVNVSVDINGIFEVFEKKRRYDD